MAVMRWFQTSGGPISGEVLASTARFSASGAFAPSHMPTMPPSDTPHHSTGPTPSPAISSRASVAMRSMVYGPAASSDWPWPRLS
jgi:hypothetical protein